MPACKSQCELSADCRLLTTNSNRLHRNQVQVLHQPDFLLQKRLSILHAGQHAVIAGAGGYAVADFGMGGEVTAAGLLIGELRLVSVDGFEASLELIGDVDHECGTNVVVESRVDDF